MMEQELKRLRRADLLEMLLDLSKENDLLRTQLDRANKQLADQTIAIEKSGSLAEAALKLNGVFDAAQAACDQYILNLQQRIAQQDLICAQMELETKKKCELMIEEAKKQADAYGTTPQKEEDTKKQVDAYRTTPGKEVDKLIDSYSWLTKATK